MAFYVTETAWALKTEGAGFIFWFLHLLNSSLEGNPVICKTSSTAQSIGELKILPTVVSED